MLPSSGVTAECPNESSTGANWQELEQRVQQAEEKLHKLVGLQAAVVQLQSMLLNGSTPLLNSTQMSNDNSDVASLRDSIDSIQTQLSLVARTANGVNDRQDTLNTRINELNEDISSLTSKTDQLQTMTTESNNRIVDIQATLSKLQSSGLVCYNKGFIVSGAVKNLPLSSIDASSIFDQQHGTDKVRINTEAKPGAWCPG